MSANKPTKEQGRQAGDMLRREAARDEREVEAAKGSPLRKGDDRFEERSESAKGERGVKPSD